MKKTEAIHILIQDVSFDMAPQKKLRVIRGVDFTPREIDVIAFLVVGKSAKTNASLLSVSPKTVESHSRNIMSKIGCNSREEVVRFVEQSGVYKLVQNHYKEILKLHLFEKYIGKLKIDEAYSRIKVFIYSPKEIHTFSSRLIKDLKHMHMYPYVQEDEKGTGPNDASIETTNDSNFSSNIVISQNANDFNQTPNQDVLTVNIKNDDDYYFVFFSILKKIIPGDNLTVTITDFQNESRKLIHEPDDIRFLEVQPINPLQQNLLKIKRNRFLITLMVICILISYPLMNIAYGLIERYFSLSSLEPIRSSLKIPFDDVLLNREKLLNLIDKTFAHDAGPIKIVGIAGRGGAGKSTLARQHAHEHRGSVVWEINADTESTIIQSLMNLAIRFIKTPEQQAEFDIIRKMDTSDVNEDHNKNAIDVSKKGKLLLAFIAKNIKKYPNWLLIYDNMSNCFGYLPFDSKIWGKGNVIITTRYSNIENATYVKAENVIKVKELESDEAITLFLKIIGRELDESTKEVDSVKLLLREIPPYPNDVSAAALFIKTSRITYNQYLEKMQKYSAGFEKMQERRLIEIGSDAKPPYAILEISIEKLVHRSRNFRNLLFIVSLLNEKNIYKEMFEPLEDEIIIDGFIYDLQTHWLIQHKEALSNYTDNDKNDDGYNLAFGVKKATQLYFSEKEKEEASRMQGTMESKDAKGTDHKGDEMTLEEKEDFLNKFLDSLLRSLNSPEKNKLHSLKILKALRDHMNTLQQDIRALKLSENSVKQFDGRIHAIQQRILELQKEQRYIYQQ